MASMAGRRWGFVGGSASVEKVEEFPAAKKKTSGAVASTQEEILAKRTPQRAQRNEASRRWHERFKGKGLTWEAWEANLNQRFSPQFAAPDQERRAWEIQEAAADQQRRAKKEARKKAKVEQNAKDKEVFENDGPR